LISQSDLDAYRALRDIQPIADLLPALVLKVEGRSAQVFVKDQGRIELDWDALAWARRYLGENSLGRKPQNASEVLRPGDLIRVRRQAPDQDQDQAKPQTKGQPRWRLAQLPQLASALVALDSRDGAIRALVGGYSFYQSKFNRVTQAKRQPGSGFKSVIYSAALEAGFTAATLINASPVMFDPGLGRTSQWRPENYTGKFYGPTRLREALTHSRNLVSIRLLQEMGLEHTLEHAARFGFDPKSLPRNFTLALGTGESTPLEMARSYAVLANGGFLVEPYFIQRIEEQDKGLIFEADPLIACPECEDQANSGLVLAGKPAPRTLSAQNAFLMNSMLRDVIRSGTATKAKSLGREDLAGKTGTTNQQRDGWFNGFHPQLTAVVWAGFDDMRPMGNKETGGNVALPAWIEFMAEALKTLPEKPLSLPAGMYRLKIDPATGAPAEPDQRKVIEEYFRVGVPQRETDSTQGGEDPQLLEPVIGPTETVSEELF
ncbi:MAG: peptidase, partial [Gammaproteobacteria bacterium]|nr:peptidase [Gammaproteobacteria bacterium]